jgi:hypothetical protein
MGDKGWSTVTAICLMAALMAVGVMLAALQRQIDTLGRQVEILERNSVNRGAMLDAQTGAWVRFPPGIAAKDRYPVQHPGEP